jgi:hypothetical protein
MRYDTEPGGDDIRYDIEPGDSIRADAATCEDCGRPYEDHQGRCHANAARIKQETEAEDIVRLFSAYINHGGKAEYIVDALEREHRTLQQQMTSVMLSWFIHLSGLESNWYDLRNEFSVRVAKAIRPVLESMHAITTTRKGRDEAHVPFI